MRYDYTPPPEILFQGDGPIRTVKLNRPEQRNAVNESLHTALSEIWAPLESDPEVRVVILTGEGKAFCAGGDMDMLEKIAVDPEYRYNIMRESRQIVTEMMGLSKPVIAAVNGPAVGLGCSLAVLSDIVLMSDRAFLSDPHVSLGVVAADGGALAWPQFVSLLHAKEYLFTGDRIDASTAEKMGLANHVVSHDVLLERAHELAERLASQPQQALRDTKRTLNIHLRRSVESVIDFAFSAESETFSLPECIPNMKARMFGK